MPCELALLAMGFVHPQHEGTLQQLPVELDERGNVKANNYKTAVDKIFTGDMRRGQSLVVWAISEGRECARGRYLPDRRKSAGSKRQRFVTSDMRVRVRMKVML